MYLRKYFVPVIGHECGPGQVPDYGVYYWPDPDFVIQVIEICADSYDIRSRNLTDKDRKQGLLVHDNFYVLPGALCHTEHEAWRRAIAWYEMMEESVLDAAQ